MSCFVYFLLYVFLQKTQNYFIATHVQSMTKNIYVYSTRKKIINFLFK